MMDKLQGIKKRIEKITPSFSDTNGFSSRLKITPLLRDMNWMVEEIERLRIVEQAYEGMKKAL